jgi:hypothetical protein
VPALATRKTKKKTIENISTFMGTTAWNNKGKKQKLSFTTKPINLRNPGPPPPYDPSLA